LKQRLVIVSDEAEEDMAQMHSYLKIKAGKLVADRYVDRIGVFLAGLDLASERGTLRSDVRPDLRIVGFERTVTVAFLVSLDSVKILRIFSGGQNWHEFMRDS
jgi:toxin ParE1/3/4